MHPDLSPHLHTEACNDIVRNLFRCRKENRITQALGACNSFNDDMLECFHQERLARREKNREKARNKNEIFKQKLYPKNKSDKNISDSTS